LLPLPQPYIVPGGRFREIYYWDSYFTMLGLRESGHEDLIESMVANFAALIARYGHIPNGNRSYYLSRSQPPFFALMVEFLAEKKGDSAFRTYRDALSAEYDYWMDRTAPTQHVVTLPGGETLNRYYDQKNEPRPEAFALDEETAAKATGDRSAVYRHIRSAAESGWDFSSRWFADGKSLATIETTDVAPVDLNCLLYQLERTLARACELTGDAERRASLTVAAERRRQAILRYCWSPDDGYFFDFRLQTRQRSTAWTLAGVAPLFLQIATDAQARAVAANVREKFLQPGGVVTTLAQTNQQWDWPNGWAPLQWMTIRGLHFYGQEALAKEIAHRWIKLNRDVYARTGRMMEKYNVVDLSLAAGGGEYDAQDGFGWTNGVLLRLLREEKRR
jgi:alpha,alpha-trehalase